MLHREILKPCDNDTPCDGCGIPLWQDEPAFIDLQAGTIYCSRKCAREDSPPPKVEAVFDDAA